nr:hypothetical protein [Fodinicola feengrottensis]
MKLGTKTDSSTAGELDRLECVAPPRPVAEQGAEQLAFFLVVAPALRLDPELAAQRDGMHRLTVRIGDAQLEKQRGTHAVLVRLSVDALEDQVSHRGHPLE